MKRHLFYVLFQVSTVVNVLQVSERGFDVDKLARALADSANEGFTRGFMGVEGVLFQAYLAAKPFIANGAL